MSSHAQQTQGAMNQPANYKPITKGAFNYDPNNYMKSTLTMGNKRTQQAPTNFIGVSSFRPPSNLPTRTYNPAGIEGAYKFTAPVMRTLPVQPKFQ
jgi:hypothetical protein